MKKTITTWLFHLFLAGSFIFLPLLAQETPLPSTPTPASNPTNQTPLAPEDSSNPTTSPPQEESREVFFYPTNENPTPLEWYARTTSVHPLRRADIIFFISIPFSILWTDFLIQRLRDLSLISAFFEGARGSEFRVSNFSYSHDRYPPSVADPYYVFKWTNGVLWPLVIVANDFLERVHDPKVWEKEKEAMIENRFNLNLIHHPYH